MPEKQLLIMHCPAGGGHKAAAAAIAERAEARGISATVVDALSLAPPWFARAYVDAHLRSSAYAPLLHGTAYFASNRRGAVDGELRHFFDRWIGKELLRSVIAADPWAVVATHFYPLAILSSARRPSPNAPRITMPKFRAPLVGVVTDYAAHAVWAEPGLDGYCAPAKAVDDLVRHGVPSSRIEATGIPIRAAFGRAPDLRPPERGEPLRVLVTSGGFGVGPIARVLRSFANIADVSLTIVCGHNPELVESARALARRFGLSADVVGFESNMAARISDAHVVVGKPGGLTVSECLAAGRPLVLVGGVPGQETLNQAWIVERGAGVVARPNEVGRCIDRLRATCDLAPMGRRARALGAPDAADRVLDAVIRCKEHMRRPHAAGLLDPHFDTHSVAAG